MEPWSKEGGHGGQKRRAKVSPHLRSGKEKEGDSHHFGSLVQTSLCEYPPGREA